MKKTEKRILYSQNLVGYGKKIIDVRLTLEGNIEIITEEYTEHTEWERSKCSYCGKLYCSPAEHP